MIIVRPQDALHKSYMLRLLTEILDNPVLSANLFFKGGTCASLMGILDRFSVDLDFDQRKDTNESILKEEFHKIFRRLDLEVKDESKNVLEFFLKYPTTNSYHRNTLKIDALGLHVDANKYAHCFLAEIDRIAICQTKETIFANKLVALMDRFKRKKVIAGRDVYDIHHFFLNGLSYNRDVIKERTQKDPQDYFAELVAFVQSDVTTLVIDQDLNTLLPYEKFRKIRKTLKVEVLDMLNQEILRLRS